MPVSFVRQALELLSDEQLAERVHEGDERCCEYLLRKYRGIVLFKSRSYFLQGAEREDMIQEGMIGLYKSIRDFRPGKGCSFRTFADVCITRQMITAVKTREGERKLSIVFVCALLRYNEESGNNRLESAPDERAIDPQDILLIKETVRELENLVSKNLSTFEWDVFIRYVDGASYAQIMEELNCTYKSIDNALCRVRRKMQRFQSRFDKAGGNGRPQRRTDTP